MTIPVVLSLITTFAFAVLIFKAYRFSVEMRHEYHARTQAKVEAYWESVERDRKYHDRIHTLERVYYQSLWAHKELLRAMQSDNTPLTQTIAESVAETEAKLEQWRKELEEARANGLL